MFIALIEEPEKRQYGAAYGDDANARTDDYYKSKKEFLTKSLVLAL